MKKTNTEVGQKKNTPSAVADSFSLILLIRNQYSDGDGDDRVCPQ